MAKTALWLIKLLLLEYKWNFRLFYEYIEEKVSDFLFVKSGSVIIFFWYNLVANLVSKLFYM
jgi:hypothetical protein